MREVFWAFFQLGLTSFGGPTAHLGYFRRAFVEQRRWIDEAGFTAIVGFCTVLPGPTSSQVGMLIGLSRRGAGGALAAWLAFTAPSAIAMTIVAFAIGLAGQDPAAAHARWFAGLLVGLTAAAAAVVAQAVYALARALCTDTLTRVIAVTAGVVAVAFAGMSGFAFVPIALGALAGVLFVDRRADIAGAALPIHVSRTAAAIAAGIFALALAFACAPQVAVSGSLAMLATIVRAGTLVFGGGHVVLPLLTGLTESGLLNQQTFFAGYGAVQAMPGPLFTFAAFVGAANTSPLHGIAGASVATIAIFAPSFALAIALVPVWNRVRSMPGAAAALRGANAGVVGLLAAVLVHPMLTTLVSSRSGIAIGSAAFALIVRYRLAPWIVVVASGAAGSVAGLLR